MVRPYHSPSSIALAMGSGDKEGCEYAWALTYIGGQRDPDVEWSTALEAYKYDEEAQLWRSPNGGATVTSRSRSTALGKAVHATFERWYEPQRGVPNWRSLPGRIANSACHLLPHPKRVERAIVEKSIGRVPIPKGHPHAPETVLEVHGVRWGGYRDLAVIPTFAEAARLKWPHGINLADYKSTADIARYALTTSELERDVQGNLYTVDMCEDFGLDIVPAHWIYLETKKVRRAHVTHATMTRVRALDVLGPCSELARKLDTYTRVEDAPKNPRACSNYGPPNKINCPHAKVNGGTCEVRRSFGALIQLGTKKKKEEITMALSAEAQAKFDKMKNAAKAAAGTPPAEEPPADTDGAQEPAGDEAPSEPTKPAATAPVKPKPAPKPKAAAPTTATGAVGVVLSLHAKLADAEAKRAAAQAEVDGVLSEIKAALA